MKSFATKIIGAAAMALSVGSASALTVEQSIFGGTNLLSDNSAEYLIKGAGNVGGAKVVESGDRLRGIFGIDSVESAVTGDSRQMGGTSGNNELTGIFDVTVVSKTALGGGGFSFVFGVTAGFAAEAAGTAGAAVAFYDGGAGPGNYKRIGCAPNTTAGCEATAVDGTLLWVAGFGGDAFWTAVTTTDDISAIGAGLGQAGGNFNIGLELLLNMGTRQLGEVTACTSTVTGLATTGLEFCGSGGLVAKGAANTPFDTFDDVNFTINVVPEPASIALFGLALLGLGASTLRRKG